MHRSTHIVTLLGCVVLLTAADAAETPIPSPVTVATMGPIQPPQAPDQALYLLRYEIAPGTRLPLHHHEGIQIGLVVGGELTYHVAGGEVPVYRTGADGKPILDRIVRAGETGLVVAGEWVVEEPGDRHWGANLGDAPLLIVTSALLREGAPLATRDPS